MFEREAYSFSEVMEDTGGFYTALVIFPKILMSLYNALMFKESIVSQVPFQKKQKPRQDPKNGPSNVAPQEQSAETVRQLYSAACITHRLKSTFCELVWHACRSCSCMHKKTKKQELKQKAFDCFEEKLDIQSFFEVHTNLALLI